MIDQPSTAEPERILPGPDTQPLPRLPFNDCGPIDGEPSTDVRIETENGLALRERMIEIAATAESSLSPTASPTTRSLVISNALLADDGGVALDRDGRPCLSSRHEVVLTNETMGRLGAPENLALVLKDAREVAAAMAEMEFAGMRLFDQVIAIRTRAIAQIEGE